MTPEARRLRVEAGVQSLTEDLQDRATAYAEANAISLPGDIVETLWAGWKRPQKVRIVSVGAHLIADWSNEQGFFLDFDMTYVAHRLHRDGSSRESALDSGICLKNLHTAAGLEWIDRQISSRNARWFNHCALSWRWQELPIAARKLGAAA